MATDPRSPSNFSGVNINMNNPIYTKRARIQSETNDNPVTERPWIATSEPSPRPPRLVQQWCVVFTSVFTTVIIPTPSTQDRGEITDEKPSVVFHAVDTRRHPRTQQCTRPCAKTQPSRRTLRQVLVISSTSSVHPTKRSMTSRGDIAATNNQHHVDVEIACVANLSRRHQRVNLYVCVVGCDSNVMHTLCVSA